MDWQTCDVKFQVGDRVHISGSPLTKRRWWQFWKPRYTSSDGVYVVTEQYPPPTS